MMQPKEEVASNIESLMIDDAVKKAKSVAAK